MKTIGIIGAMPSELAAVRATLGQSVPYQKAGYGFYETDWNGVHLIDTSCGVGKVNAAVCTQILIDTYAPDAIVHIGIAGGIDDKVSVCDMVVARDVMHHDIPPRLLDVFSPFCADYPCDETLCERAESVLREKGVPYHVGRIVSGDAFIADKDAKADILARLAPLAVDMESAAIGQCAYRNGVPFLAVRCISDRADDEAEKSVEAFEQIAADRCASVALAMM